MRRMILTRGPQGAGKSTLLRELGIESHAISADAIRQVVAGPMMTESGAMTVSQENEARVWAMLKERIDERMARGELIAVDATHRRASDFAIYRELAETHGYALFCVDFRSVPLERCLAQNAARAEHTVVPPKVVRATHAACLEGEIPEDVPRVLWSEDGAHTQAAQAFLEVPVHDLDAYEGVMHVGDIQGCATPLRELYAGGVSGAIFHVFVGDICDRGPENAEALQFVMELADKPNVAVVYGNHEVHLERYARGLDAVSDEFRLRTQPQLQSAGITPEQVGEFCARLHEAFFYRWCGTQVMVCHAGMPTVPQLPARVSSAQWRKGVGYYATPIDERFDMHAPEEWVQVRGHRNVHELPVQATPRSFVLEEQVEQGGHLRALRLDSEGFTPIRIRNRVMRSAKQRWDNGVLRHKKIWPAWIADQDDRPAIPRELLQALREHALVAEKRDPDRPYIAAFNFTRDAFFDRRWDALNTTARGLFVDVERETIVARSYDKFFNLGERPETQMKALRESLVFPVKAWVKENGYLGIIGYDAHEDELVFASKSSLQSEFAGWLKELFVARVGEVGCERMRRYLRDAQGTAVFEVIDPVRDPHICAYDAPQLILLDIVRRAPEFERLSYEGLRALGERMGLDVKERAATLMNATAFEGFCKRTNEPTWNWKGRHLEGFVFEDSAGFQVKLKLDYYAFWKRMRGLKDRLLRTRTRGSALGRDVSEPRVAHFYAWLERQADEVLAQDIIAVRSLYEAGVETPMPPPEPKEDPAVRGFARALEGLAAQVGAGETIKPETADKLVRDALLSDAKMDVLAASPLRVALVVAAPLSDARQDAADRLGVDVD